MPDSPSHPYVAVLGAGSWGTALAALACPRAEVLLWSRDPEQAQSLNHRHVNAKYLPDIPLPPSLRATADFDAAVSHACRNAEDTGLIILGVPVAGLAAICERLADSLSRRKHGPVSIVWTCKGFQQETGLLPHQLVQAALPADPSIGLGVLSGPSFADEVARGLPVALTIAGATPATIHSVTRALHGAQARIYHSTDIVGVEVGGAMKNLIAIACGISDGLGLGANARAALITRGLAEIQRLGLALGGLSETFSGLTGLGDLVLSTTGDLSRNRQVGLALAQGQSLQAILERGVTAEGVRCARAAQALGRRHSVDMPITDTVCRVLFDNLSPRDAVTELLSREARPETSGTQI